MQINKLAGENLDKFNLAKDRFTNFHSVFSFDFPDSWSAFTLRIRLAVIKISLSMIQLHILLTS